MQAVLTLDRWWTRALWLAWLTIAWNLVEGVVAMGFGVADESVALFGFGVDAVPAQDAWALGLPGFQGMRLEPGNGRGQNHDSMSHPEAEEYYFHFPDGNASIARLLARRLVPAAVPGTTADELAGRFSEPPRGEITVVIGPAEVERGAESDALSAVSELVEAGVGRRTAADLVARLTGHPRNRLYRASL